MPSNLDPLELKLIRHFSAPQLVEFLGIDTDEIVDRFSDYIEDYYKELEAEVE